MSFEPAKNKLTIGSLDDVKITVEAQYNPKELQIDKSVPWSKHGQANQANEDGIHLEFTGGDGRSMSIELLFDGFENNGVTGNGKTVEKLISDLETLASVRKPGASDENMRRPHHCVVTWGQGEVFLGTKPFKCVIESMSVKYSMFSTEGKPLRATATLKLKEAGKLSAAKGGGGAG
ncbi:MAG: hypothetical protein AB7O24_27745 [Kofleriaceae bacterium]